MVNNIEIQHLCVGTRYNEIHWTGEKGEEEKWRGLDWSTVCLQVKHQGKTPLIMNRRCNNEGQDGDTGQVREGKGTSRREGACRGQRVREVSVVEVLSMRVWRWSIDTCRSHFKREDNGENEPNLGTIYVHCGFKYHCVFKGTRELRGKRVISIYLHTNIPSFFTASWSPSFPSGTIFFYSEESPRALLLVKVCWWQIILSFF
jgi:hypothetical protein